MKVISRKALRDFVRLHPDATAALEDWYRKTRHATWTTLADTRRTFRHADLVGRRTVFNIAGNTYRLIARINYRTQRVYILHILTHQDYDKGDWK
ncbi:MAG: type II toxin-antitoxin system HigB family toxin [Desulfurellaceae bacterium]|nr:type II toxin-antitoxin system HigB family toxin [Desulfurellaceae bacterium]